MPINFKCNNLESNTQIPVDIISPDHCPVCLHTYAPNFLYGAIYEDPYGNEENNHVFSLHYCSACHNAFLAYHDYDSDGDFYDVNSMCPNTPEPPHFIDELLELSPSFVQIYTEANCAEKSGMLSLCGIGYRKSMDYLIRDYAISINPEKSDEIASLNLSQCIQKYISDERLKKLALASVWIGNDETHYIRKHPDYNISHMKKFILAFVTFIEAELAYRSASVLVSSSPSPKDQH